MLINVYVLFLLLGIGGKAVIIINLLTNI